MPASPPTADTTMPVNLSAPDPQHLNAVPGVRIGVAMAGVRKANRRDLVLLALAEGAALWGMSLALFEKATMKDGAIEQSNFDTYEVARMDGSPLQVHTHIMPHGIDVPASGVGEPGVPPFTPALCNAIFAATGKRIRSLPIKGQDLKAI